jgi:hypothetical protein
MDDQRGVGTALSLIVGGPFLSALLYGWHQADRALDDLGLPERTGDRLTGPKAEEDEGEPAQPALSVRPP